MTRSLEVDVLGRHERDRLRQIELQIAARDPELVVLLRDGQRALSRSCSRPMACLLVALLLLTAALVMLGLPASALVVAALAAGVWKLRRWRVVHLEP